MKPTSTQLSAHFASVGRVRRAAQRGFNLIELAVVTALIALGILFIVNQYTDQKIASNSENEGKSLVRVVVKTREIFPNGDFTGLTCPVLNSAGAFGGSNFQVAGVGAAAIVNHQLGAGATTVTCAPATINAGNDAFVLTYQNVPTDYCKAAIPQMAKAGGQITIGAVVVKTFVQPTAAVTYGTQCEGAATVNIAVTYGRT